MRRATLDTVASERGGLVTRSQLLGLGMTSDAITRACRAGQLLRRARGIYGVPAVPPAHDVHVISTRLRAVVSHDTAALWWGMELAHTPERQHLTVRRSRGRKADEVQGVRLHRYDLCEHDIAVRRGVRVTTPVRTVLDCARTLSLENAVTVADSAIRRRLVTLAELEAAARSLAKGPLRRRVWLVLSLVDPKCGSVLESLCRVLLWRNGLCPPSTQWAFRNELGNVTAYVDFAWPAAHLLLEADGFEFHSRADDHRRDLRRANELVRSGYRLVRVTWFDVVHDPDYVVQLVRDMLAAPSAA